MISKISRSFLEFSETFKGGDGPYLFAHLGITWLSALSPGLVTGG